MDGKRKQFACVDAKAFYASVECVDRGLDPLTTNLVVADESRSDGTICLAVSPSLKALGVPGRPRLFEVKQLLAEIKALTGQTVPYITAMPRMARYLEVSSEIYGIYLKYLSPSDIHVYSVDECFMDLTPYLRLYNMTAHELVTTMIRDVLATQGITATGGIGTNLYLAKIAMDITAKKLPADKDGVRVAELDKQSFREKLWCHEPLTDFWQIGPGIAAHLARMGIHTMGDLARLSLTNEEIFFREFGVDAEILIDHAWGIESCGTTSPSPISGRSARASPPTWAAWASTPWGTWPGLAWKTRRCFSGSLGWTRKSSSTTPGAWRAAAWRRSKSTSPPPNPWQTARCCLGPTPGRRAGWR